MNFDGQLQEVDFVLVLFLKEVKVRFPDGLPLLDPIEDMGIKDDGLKSVIRVRMFPVTNKLQL